MKGRTETHYWKIFTAETNNIYQHEESTSTRKGKDRRLILFCFSRKNTENKHKNTQPTIHSKTDPFQITGTCRISDPFLAYATSKENLKILKNPEDLYFEIFRDGDLDPQVQSVTEKCAL